MTTEDTQTMDYGPTRDAYGKPDRISVVANLSPTVTVVQMRWSEVDSFGALIRYGIRNEATGEISEFYMTAQNTPKLFEHLAHITELSEVN